MASIRKREAKVPNIGKRINASRGLKIIRNTYISQPAFWKRMGIVSSPGPVMLDISMLIPPIVPLY